VGEDSSLSKTHDGVAVTSEHLLFLLSLLPHLAKFDSIDAQDGICPLCQEPIPVFDVDNKTANARRCHFDGLFYCTHCHVNQMAYIPALVFSAADFDRYPVGLGMTVSVSDAARSPTVSLS
jgi:hypothetical protein